MSKQALSQTIRKKGGLIISEGTLDTVSLLCTARDLLMSWGIRTQLTHMIDLAIGMSLVDQTASHAYYYNRLKVHATPEELFHLWSEDVFNLFNEIAPKGYYFGSHEGDGACIGWFSSTL